MLRMLAFVIAGLSLLCSNLKAQEFSVYTKVFDLDARETNQPIARSLTLFHVGKVYDWIYGTAEITILEPAHRRISVLDSGKRLICNVEFDELKHMLESAEERLAQQIQELDGLPKPPREQVEALRFQLRPFFETEFDASKHRLRLLSKSVSYEVTGQTNVRPEAVDAYLNYADWACRLNYVLHPQPLFPTARLELNERLRQQKLLPVEVTLRAKLGRPLNLKAEHSLGWALEPNYRQSIHNWESLLRDPKLQKVSLSEYQRIALSQQTVKSR